MATIVTRSGKGSALSHSEMDSNFTNLNNDKEEIRQFATKAEMESGSVTNIRTMSPLRIKEAIEALSPTTTTTINPDIDFGINLL